MNTDRTDYRIPFTGYRLWLLLILSTAVFLRFYRLSQVPPGLTHDEAAHGLTAWEIVNGRFALYFTITPHPVHSPALALLALHRDDLLHWFDGRRSLLLPSADESYLIFPGYALLTPDVPAGGLAQIVTWWEVERPLPDARQFIHMLDESGAVLAQEDRLDVPGAGWQPGKMFVQLHQFTIPEGTLAGPYPLTVGLYTFTDTAGPRLPITVDRQSAGDNYLLTTIIVNDTKCVVLDDSRLPIIPKEEARHETTDFRDRAAAPTAVYPRPRPHRTAVGR